MKYLLLFVMLLCTANNYSQNNNKSQNNIEYRGMQLERGLYVRNLELNAPKWIAMSKRKDIDLRRKWVYCLISGFKNKGYYYQEGYLYDPTGELQYHKLKKKERKVCLEAVVFCTEIADFCLGIN